MIQVIRIDVVVVKRVRAFRNSNKNNKLGAIVKRKSKFGTPIVIVRATN